MNEIFDACVELLHYWGDIVVLTYKEIQEVIKAKGGINGIPKFLSIMINCPEGRWCGL